MNNPELSKNTVHDPHVFILDINGEYANAFLDSDKRKYSREPNKAYVNGEEFAIPVWLMNSQEVCEWLSAAEQTQQPVLKAWWAHLKAPQIKGHDETDYLDEAQAAIATMRASQGPLRKNEARDLSLLIHSYLAKTNIDTSELDEVTESYRIRDSSEPGGFKNFFGGYITNGPEVASALSSLSLIVEEQIRKRSPKSYPLASGDTPSHIAVRRLGDTSNLVSAASQEDAPKIDQHLTTLRMRLKTRLTDRRWSVFSNYDSLGVTSPRAWFQSLGFAGDSRVVVIDLSMLAHEALPYACATIGRVLLEAREKLPADQRFRNPWVLVLEEAHNYARPHRQTEERGQALSRAAFERVAKEGRKFGLSLVVASQRPSEISPTIISQCANFLSHRLQNPDDIDHFKRIIPKQAQRLLDQVTVLAAGEAIVFGSAMHIPVRVQIKTPSQEPWSATAAPYAEWANDQVFPIDEVLAAWGVEESVGSVDPAPVDEEEDADFDF